METLDRMIRLLHKQLFLLHRHARRGIIPVGVAVVMFVTSLLGLWYSFRVLEVSTISRYTGAASPSQPQATNTPKPPSQDPQNPLPTNTSAPDNNQCPASCNCGCDSNHPGQCNPDTCHGNGATNAPNPPTFTPTPTVCPGPDYSNLKFLVDYLDDPTVTSSLQPVIYPPNVPVGYSLDRPWQYANLPPGNYKLEWTIPTGAVKYGLRIWDIGTINNASARPFNASLCSANPTPNPAGINDVCTDTLTTNFINYRFEAGHEYAIWLHAINACGGGWTDNRGLNVEIWSSTPDNPVSCATSCASIGQSGTASVCTYKDHPAFQQLVCSGFWASPQVLDQAASVPNFISTCTQCPPPTPTATPDPSVLCSISVSNPSVSIQEGAYTSILADVNTPSPDITIQSALFSVHPAVAPGGVRISSQTYNTLSKQIEGNLASGAGDTTGGTIKASATVINSQGAQYTCITSIEYHVVGATTPTATPQPTVTLVPAAPTTPTATPILPTPTPLPPPCEALSVNSTDKTVKHDIILLPENFTSMDDFRSYAQDVVAAVDATNMEAATRSKLNFWLHTDLFTDYDVTPDGGQGYTTKVTGWDYETADESKRACEGDSYLIIANFELSPEWKAAGVSYGLGLGNALVMKFGIFTAPHELCHSIASCFDEYSFGITAGPTHIPYNCTNEFSGSNSTACPLWARDNVTAGCYATCGYTNWYRAELVSVMTYGRNINFSAPALRMWEVALSNYQ